MDNCIPSSSKTHETLPMENYPITYLNIPPSTSPPYDQPLSNPLNTRAINLILPPKGRTTYSQTHSISPSTSCYEPFLINDQETSSSIDSSLPQKTSSIP